MRLHSVLLTFVVFWCHRCDFLEKKKIHKNFRMIQKQSANSSVQDRDVNYTDKNCSILELVSGIIGTCSEFIDMDTQIVDAEACWWHAWINDDENRFSSLSLSLSLSVLIYYEWTQTETHTETLLNFILSFVTLLEHSIILFLLVNSIFSGLSSSM